MIPFVGGSAILPHVETTGLINKNIALTLVHPFKQLSSIPISPAINNSFSPAIRILQSRTQRRRSSVSSLCSLLKFEDEDVRKLSSRGSSVLANCELRLCFETKQLTNEHFQNNVNLESTPCPSSDAKEDEDTAENYSRSDARMPDVAIDNHSPDIIFVEAKKDKCKRAKSNSKTKSKKHSKSKKSPKRKGSMKYSNKIPNVFERLANVSKIGNNQEKLCASSNTQKCSTTIFYNKSSGSLLEIKRLQATYKPVNKPNRPRTLLCLPKVAMTSCRSNSVKDFQQPKHFSGQQLHTTKSSNQIMSSPRKSLEVTVQESSKNDSVGPKKVYLSEVQSKMFGGVPGAPPATPFPDELARVEYIPCLMDVKSQRAVKSKLEKMVLKLKSEEQQQRENAIKQDQKKLRESLMQLKQQQRTEIYALNKVMTELENENFKNFMTKKEAINVLGV